MLGNEGPRLATSDVKFRWSLEMSEVDWTGAVVPVTHSKQECTNHITSLMPLNTPCSRFLAQTSAVRNSRDEELLFLA